MKGVENNEFKATLPEDPNEDKKHAAPGQFINCTNSNGSCLLKSLHLNLLSCNLKQI